MKTIYNKKDLTKKKPFPKRHLSHKIFIRFFQIVY